MLKIRCFYNITTLLTETEYRFIAKKHVDYVSSGEYGSDKDFGYAVAFARLVAASILGATGVLSAGGAYLYSEGAAALSQITWSSAGISMASNATTQYLVNGRSFGDINAVSTVSSIVPGIGPAIFGETINWTPNNIIAGEGTQMPDSFNKWAVQAGSALLSNRFGKATDSCFSGGSFTDNVVGEYFKGVLSLPFLNS